ncbi:MAG TPA: DUF3093 domain-containing protein [Jatrophihabitans sp.]|nr:DUF3093 domain-containing protein [Jatrophihabitans sp.]
MIEPATHQAGAGSPAGYVERMRTPWWWYPAGALVGVLLGAEFAFIIPAWLTWLPIVLSVLLAVLVVWRLGSATVRVRDGELVAGERSLPVRRIAQAIDLSPTELRRVVGRHGDPLAHNFVRSWIGPGLQLVLTDRPTEDDRIPEPYWLISTRHPDRVIAAIDAGQPDRPAED